MLFFLFDPIHICSWLIEPELIRMPEKHGILRADDLIRAFPEINRHHRISRHPWIARMYMSHTIRK